MRAQRHSEREEALLPATRAWAPLRGPATATGGAPCRTAEQRYVSALGDSRNTQIRRFTPFYSARHGGRQASWLAVPECTPAPGCEVGHLSGKQKACPSIAQCTVVTHEHHLHENPVESREGEVAVTLAPTGCGQGCSIISGAGCLQLVPRDPQSPSSKWPAQRAAGGPEPPCTPAGWVALGDHHATSSWGHPKQERGRQRQPMTRRGAQGDRRLYL